MGPLSSVSPGMAIRQVLSGESLRELESFQLLEDSPTSEALALPLAHPQPPFGAWQPLQAAIPSSGPSSNSISALLRVRRRSWDPFAFALQGLFSGMVVSKEEEKPLVPPAHDERFK